MPHYEYSDDEDAFRDFYDSDVLAMMDEDDNDSYEMNAEEAEALIDAFEDDINVDAAMRALDDESTSSDDDLAMTEDDVSALRVNDAGWVLAWPHASSRGRQERWTPEEDADLRRVMQKEMSVRDFCKAHKSRSPLACYSRIKQFRDANGETPNMKRVWNEEELEELTKEDFDWETSTFKLNNTRKHKACKMKLLELKKLAGYTPREFKRWSPKELEYLMSEGVTTAMFQSRYPKRATLSIKAKRGQMLREMREKSKKT